MAGRCCAKTSHSCFSNVQDSKGKKRSFLFFFLTSPTNCCIVFLFFSSDRSVCRKVILKGVGALSYQALAKFQSSACSMLLSARAGRCNSVLIADPLKAPV